MAMNDRRTLLVACCLVGAALVIFGGFKIAQHIRWSISVLQPYSYHLKLPQDQGTFDLDKGIVFAFEKVRELDDSAKLTFMGWLTACAKADSTEDQEILYDFVGTKLHFGWPRMFSYSVDISPQTESAELVVMKILNKIWERRLLDIQDVKSMPVDFTQSLSVARRNGGSKYEATQPSCFMRIRLQEGNWYFVYSSDEYGVHDLFELRVDGSTGEVVRM